jgi:hypothetical protein
LTGVSEAVAGAQTKPIQSMIANRRIMKPPICHCVLYE